MAPLMNTNETLQKILRKVIDIIFINQLERHDGDLRSNKY